MDLQTVLRMVRKLWVLVAALALVGALAGVAVAQLVPAGYTATTRLYFSFQSAAGSTAADLVAANNFAVQKVFSYVQVASTPRVLNPVIKELDLDTTAEDLAKDVTVSVASESVVISISATASNPQDAATLTNAIGDSFINVVTNELDAPADGGAAPVRAEKLETAIPPTAPAGPGTIVEAILGLFIGLVVGLLVAVVLALSDRRVHNRDELERLLQVRVLGSLPVADATRPLVVERADGGFAADAYKTLAATTMLDRALVAGGAVTVLSPTRREQTAGLVANTAVALARSGLTVTMVDGDFDRHGLSDLFGMKDEQGLAEALTADAAVAPRDTSIAGLSLLPSGAMIGEVADAHGTERLRTVLAELVANADVVLVAAPPALGDTGRSGFLAAATTGAVLVVEAGRTRLDEVRESIDTLDRTGVEVRVALTAVPTSGPDSDVRSRALVTARR